MGVQLAEGHQVEMGDVNYSDLEVSYHVRDALKSARLVSPFETPLSFICVLLLFNYAIVSQSFLFLCVLCFFNVSWPYGATRTLYYFSLANN